jgi:hypothetical protein
MTSNYAAIIQANVQRLFTLEPRERAAAMAAEAVDGALSFKAFSQTCRMDPNGVHLDGVVEDGPKGIIISLYALHAVEAACQIEPLKSFKQMPDSAPYAGAFANRTEQSLAPAVERLEDHLPTILDRLEGTGAPAHVSGDLAFIVWPLPKIALCYVCYLADDDFPAGVTCLYSSNASLFLPTDALADVGEYTSRTILELVNKKKGERDQSPPSR